MKRIAVAFAALSTITGAARAHGQLVPRNDGLMLGAHTLVAAGVGYVICSMIWPGFYYRALNPGKNLWLAAQGLCILVFVIGLLYAIAGIRKASEVRP